MLRPWTYLGSILQIVPLCILFFFYLVSTRINSLINTPSIYFGAFVLVTLMINVFILGRGYTQRKGNTWQEIIFVYTSIVFEILFIFIALKLNNLG